MKKNSGAIVVIVFLLASLALACAWAISGPKLTCVEEASPTYCN